MLQDNFLIFFNAYTLAINKRFKRTGSLFEKPFERKLIKNESYLLQLILYIHNNPKSHGVVKNVEDYKWSSYQAILSNSPTKLQRDKVLEYFEDRENFIFCHQNY